MTTDPPAGGGWERRLAEAEATIQSLHEELAESNRGLMALNLEVEQRVDERTAELRSANAALREEIGQRRTAEEKLLLQSAALAAAANSIIITDAAGTILWANEAFSRMTGYPREEAVGQTPRMLKSGRKDASYYEKLWTTIKRGEVWHDVITDRRKDGGLIDVEFTITPVADAAGQVTHFVAITQDVTEKLLMEKQLLRSQRMESIGLLAGGVAHDLNNILTPISIAVEMLKEELPRADRIELAETLEHNCRRGAEIIRQVLTFARGVDGERVLVQLRHLVKEMVRIAAETFPRNVVLQADVPRDLWPTLGDATQLHQVLLNLCVNARDALMGGGRIEISGANVTLARERTFMEQTVPPGRYTYLCVADTGPGIPLNVAERVFEPFFTTKPDGEGTGLGLSSALGIVRSHHGLLELDPRPGKGARFHLYLPAAESPAAGGEPAVEPPGPTGRGETVLLVDDEPGIITVAGSLLRQSGYEVLTAGNGVEAVSRFVEQRGRIALVLTDVMMPLMDGVALARALRSIDPEVKIIGTSGFVGDANNRVKMDDLRRLGVTKIIKKPFQRRELLTVLAAILRAKAAETRLPETAARPTSAG